MNIIRISWVFAYITLITDPEIMETFDRANYRQSGSSLDSNNDFKKKKNGKIFKFGMFK